MRNVSGKRYIENQNTLPSENRAVFDIMWENLAEPDRPLMAI
jgi:hypothetical protein